MGTKCHTHMLVGGIIILYTGTCYIFVYFVLDFADSVLTLGVDDDWKRVRL